MTIFSGYQTINVPGVFPTKSWFSTIETVIDFKDQVILDVGCNDGMYGIMALDRGAKKVFGIDSAHRHSRAIKILLDERKIPRDKFEFIEGKAEDIDLGRSESFNMLFLHMIIHWFDEPTMQICRLVRLTSDYVSIIFRAKNSHYQSINGKYFPTPKELDKLLKPEKLKAVLSKVLMTQDNNKDIHLRIYEKHI